MSTKECHIYKIINILYQLDSDLKKIPLSNKVISHKEQQGEQSEEKRSLWVRFWASFKRIGKAKKDASNHASDSGGSQGGSRRFVQDIEVQKNEELEIRKLQNDIRQMIAAFESLTQFQTEMSNNLERDLRSNKLIAILQRKNSFGSRSHVVKEIRRKVSALKCQIPSLLNKQPSRKISITESQTAEENDEISETGIDIYLPGLHVAEEFKKSSAFEEVVEKFQGLDDITHKLCLLSFAVFPENREVTRTMLMYWWIGEGFISCYDSENSVTSILDAFSAKKLLEPVEDERKLLPNSYKMEPHVHSAVIYLAKEMDLFELYSHNGELIMKKSSKKKVCLVKDSSLLRDAKTSVMEPKTLQTVFNSSERYPDFTFKWFPLMDSLRVLYLGRWEQTAKRHIEVESTEFLKNMKSLKNLRLASFQGISRIERLENSICALRELVILDLKACYNLEVLPSDIGLFEKLIYLDVSECYMLDSMPKGIAKLSSLQVLKGFVISESDHEDNCAVKHLKNLRKLSITVNKYSFKVETLMRSLIGLQKLVSLKIAWGAREEPNEAVESRESKNKEKENQGGLATDKKLKDLMEHDDDQVQKKGHTSKEEKGNVEEMGKQEDGVSSKKGDGINEEANLEDGKKHDEVKEERSLKSDKVVEEEKKTSPSEEATEKIQNKTSDQKGKSNVEGDGDKGKADLEDGKKQDEVEAEKSKSDEVVEAEKKASPPRDSSDMIQKKPDDKSKVENKGDGDKENDDLDEGKKRDEVEAKKSESDKVVEGDEKASPPQESKDMIQNRTDDQTKVEKEGEKHDEVKAKKSESGEVVEGDEKASPPQESKDMTQNKTDDQTKVEKEGEKHDEVEAKKSESDKVVGGDEKASLPQESKDMIQNRTNDQTKVEKKEEKHDEVEAKKSESDKVVEGEEKASPPQESKDTIQNRTDDQTKVENEGKKHDEVEARISKSENDVEGANKASPSRESTNAIQNKPDDHQRGDKQEEKGDGEEEKVNLEEGKKHDEIKAESSKEDKVTEGDAKTSPPQESKDTMESKKDDHKENSKVQEKGDGDKGKAADLDEGKKKNEVIAESSKPDNVIEGDEKKNPPQESNDTVQSKPDDHREISKVQEIGDGEKNGDDLKKLDGGEAKTQKSHKTTKFGKNVNFSEKSKAPKKPDDPKSDNTTAEEIHETPSPCWKTKSRKAKLLMGMGNQTKKWGIGWQEDQAIYKFPGSLKKLELECFPETEPPSWLNPKDLKELKKLSIKGGKLSGMSDESQNTEDKWAVEILRLKYLHEFKVEWRDLKDLFPKMTLLEKYKCPKITFCPTDGNGVWRSQPETSPNM